MKSWSRPRWFLTALASGFVLTLLSTNIPGIYARECTDIDAAGPCILFATGFPFPFLVDHWLYSARSNVNLISLLLGEDLFVWTNALASLLFWTVSVLVVLLVLDRTRPPRP